MLPIKHFLLAVQFFTRIPVTGRLAAWVGYSPAMLRASAAHFPGVGYLVGAVAAGVFWLCLQVLPGTFAPLIAAALSTVATVMLTGGFHEDGLADVADGLGGSYERARALEIMKDSRVGAFGAMALCLVLVCKVAALAGLGEVGRLVDLHTMDFDAALVCLVIVAAHVCSRAAPLVLIALLPHVGDSATSKSKPLADQISAKGLLVGVFWIFPLIVSVIWLKCAIYFALPTLLMLLALLYMWRLFARRLQGFTGDCLGATQQVCEVAFYLGALVAIEGIGSAGNAVLGG